MATGRRGRSSGDPGAITAERLHRDVVHRSRSRVGRGPGQVACAAIGLALAVLLGRCGGMGPLPAATGGTDHGPWSSEARTACVAGSAAPPDRRITGDPETTGERILLGFETC